MAERKTKNILFCGGKVKVVSPELTDWLSEMVRQKKIDYIQSEYHSGLLVGAFLAYAATSNRKVNAQIGKEAAKLGIPVNVCDSTKESTFILPAVLRRRGVTLSVSTGGESPAKSIKTRDKLKKYL